MGKVDRILNEKILIFVAAREVAKKKTKSHWLLNKGKNEIKCVFLINLERDSKIF